MFNLQERQRASVLVNTWSRAEWRDFWYFPQGAAIPLKTSRFNSERPKTVQLCQRVTLEWVEREIGQTVRSVSVNAVEGVTLWFDDCILLINPTHWGDDVVVTPRYASSLSSTRIPKPDFHNEANPEDLLAFFTNLGRIVERCGWGRVEILEGSEFSDPTACFYKVGLIVEGNSALEADVLLIFHQDCATSFNYCRWDHVPFAWSGSWEECAARVIEFYNRAAEFLKSRK